MNFLDNLSLSTPKRFKGIFNSKALEREWSAAPPTAGLENCKILIVQHPLDKMINYWITM
jgi:hypothetical protein